MNMNQFGERISTCRQNQGMTQEEFASRLGVTAQAVSKWERALSLPDITLMEGICRVLGMSANELLDLPTTRIVEDNDLAMQREIKSALFAEPMTLEIGVGLVPIVEAGLKTDEINQRRRQLAREAGILMPMIRIRDQVVLPEMQARILVYHTEVWSENIALVPEGQYAYLAGQLERICRARYADILNKQLMKNMLDTVKEQFPGIVDGVIPEKISYLTVTLVCKECYRRTQTLHPLLKMLELLERVCLLQGETEPTTIARIIMDELGEPEVRRA